MHLTNAAYKHFGEFVLRVFVVTLESCQPAGCQTLNSFCLFHKLMGCIWVLLHKVSCWWLPDPEQILFVSEA